jgi:hypothetical protein
LNLKHANDGTSTLWLRIYGTGYHWAIAGLTRGTYLFSVTYENPNESSVDGIPLWVGSATTPNVTLVIE